jgi:hypothetical protein
MNDKPHPAALATYQAGMRFHRDRLRGLAQVQLDEPATPEMAEWALCVAALREHSLRCLIVLDALSACWHRDETCAEQP